MATIDLGKISFTQKGTWASGTAYTAKDVVQYTDGNDTSSYVAIASSTGQAPSTNGTLNSSNWALMAKGAAIGSTYQSTYASGTTYNKGDVVQYTDSGVLSTFIFVNTTPTAGQTPSTGGTVNTTYWSLLAKGTASVAISWQSTAKTANFTASASEGYFVDTNGGSVTITTPASPSAGDEFIVADLRGTFGTNPVIFDGNGSDKIKGSTDNSQIAENYGSTRLVYSGATYGWLPVTSASTASEPLVSPYNIQYLVVGGGGGAGGDNGGGGGAGGMRFNSSRDFEILGGTTYTVTVGSGGLGGTNTNGQGGTNVPLGANGGDSIFSTITSAGGGGGGSAGTAGAAGGSGGGGSQNTAGGSGNTPSTSPSQGNNGGSSTATDSGGAGGGGAGAAGTSTGGEGANGGAGASNSITGSAVTYAGGGGGGERQSDNGSAGSGGSGGGANGSASGNGINAVDNLGGGGGGGSQYGDAVGGTGGSGVVILRMLTSNYSGTTTGSPTVTTTGSGASEETILKYTASGSYTA